jgi:hypothetical protein
MSRLQPISYLLNQFNIPVQNLTQLSFCDGTREKSVSAWVSALPLTQTQFVSGLLYQALPEVSRLKIAPTNRIAILEILRPVTLQALEGLTQSFLNQPLILPEPAVKTATIAQALLKHMINGYLAAVQDICTDKKINKELLSLSIHRAMTGLSLLLLRYYQLYVPISNQLWKEFHSLYQLALREDVSELVINARDTAQRYCPTITLAYERAMLLACAKPNQLRQEEILSTYNVLDKLCEFVKLEDARTSKTQNLFCIDLNSHRPPFYRAQFKIEGQPLLLELNTALLCKNLNEAATSVNLESSNSNALRNEFKLTATLTSHLIQSLSVLSQRNTERKSLNGNLDVAVGITNIHYYLAGKKTFNEFLKQPNISHPMGKIGSLFQKQEAAPKDTTTHAEDDPWGGAFDIINAADGDFANSDDIEKLKHQRNNPDFNEAFPYYNVPLIDSSLGGYCIEWNTQIPHQVKAGELLGLRDASRTRWIIGAIRWVNQTKNATQLGIQILSTQALPIGLAIIHKAGNSSEYLRALEIPASNANKNMGSMITNSISFHEHSKALVFREGQNPKETKHLLLTNMLFSTGSISQFAFKELAAPPKNDAPKKDSFDSEWDV